MVMELRLWLTSAMATWCDFLSPTSASAVWNPATAGRELVKLEGAEAIQELQRMADLAQEGQVRAMQPLAQAA